MKKPGKHPELIEFLKDLLVGTLAGLIANLIFKVTGL